jgi:hypothetical protein
MRIRNPAKKLQVKSAAHLVNFSIQVWRYSTRNCCSAPNKASHNRHVYGNHLILDSGVLRIGDEVLKAAPQCPQGPDDVRDGSQLVGPELKQNRSSRLVMQKPDLIKNEGTFFILFQHSR